MLDKYEMLTEKMKDIPKLSEEIIKVYKEEYDDSFEKILIDSEITFMKNLSSHVESIIEEKYSQKSFILYGISKSPCIFTKLSIDLL